MSLVLSLPLALEVGNLGPGLTGAKVFALPGPGEVAMEKAFDRYHLEIWASVSAGVAAQILCTRG